MSNVVIEYLFLDALKAYPRNARSHSKKQIRQIAESISQFGFTNPLLIDSHNMILAGHGRLAAAKLLGMTQLPCVRLDKMTTEQKRAYVLADNKLALNAGWDEELLGLEFQELLNIELDFDIGVTGFSIAEVDSLIDGLNPEEASAPEEEWLPEIVEGPPVTQLGDVWDLGGHRLVCGDALSPEVCAVLMNGELAQMVFTDPPYNVPIHGHAGGLGSVRHREFGMASGEMSSPQFTAFLETAFQNLVNNSIDGSIHFISMDWRHMTEIMAAGTKVFSELKNLIVWAKDNGGMGTFYRSKHELIFAFKNGKASHINSFELGQHGRYRTNVWQYAGLNSLKSGRMAELRLHPTVKPVAMIADAIKDVSKRNGIILDLFGGSGSALIAAHKTGRRAFLCELDPVYCDRTIRRWEIYAKDDAVRVDTGETFETVNRIRARQNKADTLNASIPISETANSDMARPQSEPTDLAGLSLVQEGDLW